MLFLPFLASSAHPSEATHPLLLTNPAPLPGRRQLRHLIMGSPEDVRAAIHQLHKLRYAEQLAWSQLIAIPAAGLTLTPAQGEVLSLLKRDIG